MMTGLPWSVYCGDAIEVVRGEDIKDIGAVVMDPPYSSGARRDANKGLRDRMTRVSNAEWFSHDDMTTWGFSWFLRALMVELKSRIVVGGHIYCFTDWRQAPNVIGLLESCGYRVNHCLVWKKSHFGMGTYWRNQHENIVFASNGKPNDMASRSRGTVLDCAGISAARRVHPTEKPVDLLRQIISAITAETVLDPFMGSGTTGLAALEEGRRFIGIDVNPNYVAMVRKRLLERP